MADEKKNIRFIFQFIMLLLLLVIFPISSYFWMRGGTEYRKERIGQLNDLGKVGEFEVFNEDGKLINQEVLFGKMVLATFLSENLETAKKQLGRIGLLQNQLEEGLKERKDMLYLIHVPTDSVQYLKYRVTDYQFDFDKQFLLVSKSKSELVSIAKDNYKIELENNVSLFEQNILTLVDLQGTVRRHYDSMNNEEMGHLVEHMAIILPKGEEKDIIFKRDSEK